MGVFAIAHEEELPPMPLTDFAVKSAKPKAKPYKLADGGGLHILINPNGSKLWRLKYRYFGKEKLLSYGKYPYISIADARAKREEAKKHLAHGVDPAHQKKLAKFTAAKAAATTFGLVADEYLERMKERNVAPSTLVKNSWLLENLAAPLRNRPIAEIIPAEILDVLQRIEKSGRRESARRLRGVVGSVFRYAVVTLRATGDPTTALHGALLAPEVMSRPAITNERQLGGLLRNIDEYDGWSTIRAALQFLMLTCVRPGEIRGATQSEIDLNEGVWTIPAERMKMRKSHKVPLSRQSRSVLSSVQGLSKGDGLIFPSIRSSDKPLSENALNSALRRMGYSKEEVTAHGFRASASSILNNRGYDPDVIEAVLAHQEPNKIRRAYNRSSYWDQRVELMQEWADLLDSFRIAN